MPSVPNHRPLQSLRPRAQTVRGLRRLLFLGVAAVMVAAVVEIISASIYWSLTGKPFSYAELAGMRAMVASGGDASDAAPEAAVQRAVRSSLALHPYLGFVYDIENNQDRSPLSLDGMVDRWGFMNDTPPIRRRSPDRFLVAVTGGSLAFQLSSLAHDTIVAELMRSPSLAGRRIEIIRLALGGFKQPQQLFALTYLLSLGAEFDLVINIDGFNEVALLRENFPHGIPPHYPRSWGSLIESIPSRQRQVLLGRLEYLRESRVRRAARLSGLEQWSVTAQLVWWLQDRSYAHEIAEAALAVQNFAGSQQSFARTGPGTAGMTEADAYATTADTWLRCSVLMHQICIAHGASYFHFLQPNQYVVDSKPMDSAERAASYDVDHFYRHGVLLGYPLLAARGVELRRAGVRFEDLRNVFRNVRRPLYIDTCCHLNRAGYELLAQRVTSAIRHVLDVGDATLVEMRLSASSIDIHDPRQPASLGLIGIYDNGVELELIEETSLIAADPDMIEVDGAGRLWARRRGQTEIIVRNGSFERRVEVTASWPSVLEGDDGKPGQAGFEPRLMVVGGPLTAADRTLALRCTGLPAAACGLLVYALHPVAAIVPDEILPVPDGGVLLLRAGDGPDGPGAAEAVLPLANAPLLRDRPLFLRAFMQRNDGAGGVAISNSVVVTAD